MSQDARCAESFLCALFLTVVKPFSDLRLLISGLCALLFALCFPADAQEPAKVAKIGWLGARPAATAAEQRELLGQELRALGYVEGKNIAFEYRYADNEVDRLPTLADELVPSQS